MPLQLNERILFVIGKGGVGKTTAACAIALAAADRGEATHLISTDPAHSIADVLDETADLRTARPVRCSPELMAETFDAAAYAHSLFESARPQLAALVEQGTWLDAADAAGFLDLSLPGVDEVMGALRIAELFEQHTGRIVVDTAPTGHALRLLGAASVLDGWIDALQAMAGKAGAVTSAFAGQSVRLPAEELIENWSDRMRAFEHALAAAGFVVVTREGPVVEAETVRLITELQRRRLTHTTTVVTAGTRAHDAATVPWLENPVGCDGLRRWWAAVGGNTLPEPAAAQTPVPAVAPQAPTPAVAAQAPVPAVTTSSPVRDWLLAQNAGLLLFAGKGGVGKTTCAAAVALLSGQAAPARLFSTDPAGSLGEVLQVPVASEPRRIDGITAVQVDAAGDFARMRDRYQADVEQVFEQFGISAAAHLDQRVVEALWDMAPPGLDEIMAVVRLMDEISPDRRVVVDSAPTGHFLNFVSVPDIGLEWTHALLRVLLKYRAASVLEHATREILTLARRLRAFRETLSDPNRSAAFIVALDQPVVWNETRRLHESLILANIPVAALILNRADAGPARGFPHLNPMPRIIRAPIQSAPTGTDRLLDFVNGWEFLDL